MMALAAVRAHLPVAREQHRVGEARRMRERDGRALPLIARIDLVAIRERVAVRCQPPRNSRTSRPSDHATICFAW